MKTYTDWNQVPAHLKTKTSLKKMGLKLKRGQQPVAQKQSVWRSRVSLYDLYDVSEAVPNELSPAQQAALEKAQAASLAARTCRRCGWVAPLGQQRKPYVIDGLCSYCELATMIEDDRRDAIAWAARLLDGLSEGVIEAQEVLILDSETTDLYGEIIELAMIDLNGAPVYQQRFRPQRVIAEGAQRVHGISLADLEACPTFAEEYETIRQLLEGAGKVLIYNAEYDTTCMRLTCQLHDVPEIAINDECLMTWYAAFCGDWSEKYHDYRYPPLGGDHSALGDCRAALGVLRHMAAAKEQALER